MNSKHQDGHFWRNEQVQLPPLEIPDSEVMHSNSFDSEARFFLYGEVTFPRSIEDVANFISKHRKLNYESRQLFFAIENLDGEMVGTLKMDSIDEKNGTFGSGIQIWTPFTGQGYGTAAMQILLRFAFLERRMNKFSEIVLDGNVASRRMMEKLGCKNEGIRRQQIFSNGKYHDEWCFGLLKSEYLENLHKKSE